MAANSSELSGGLKVCDGETKDLLNLIGANSVKDCDNVDMEDFEESRDVPVPMFVKHTAAILDEVDEVVRCLFHT